MKIRPDSKVLSLLKLFAQSRITTDELRSALLQIAGRKRGKNRRDLPLFGLRSMCPPRTIRITKRHLDRALTRTRRKEITERQLVSWATMILINDAFYWTGKDAGLIGEWILDLSMDLVVERDKPGHSKPSADDPGEQD